MAKPVSIIPPLTYGVVLSPTLFYLPNSLLITNLVFSDSPPYYQESISEHAALVTSGASYTFTGPNFDVSDTQVINYIRVRAVNNEGKSPWAYVP